MRMKNMPEIMVLFDHAVIASSIYLLCDKPGILVENVAEMNEETVKA
jgi:hypothetical protein